MKKLLGSTLALALIVPATANAELLKNFKMGGSLEVDAVSATNVKDLATVKYDDISTIQTRLMVKADWDLLDDVHAHVSLDKNDRTWGGTAAGNTAGGTSQNLNGIESTVWVDESYVKIDKLFGALDTTVGRQFYGESGDLVIYFGPKYNLYGMPITALDAARFDWNGEKAGVTILGGKVKSAGLGATDTADVNLYGLDVHAKPMDNVSGSAYIYNRNTINSGTGALNVVANDHLYVAGLKGKVTAGIAWLKAEVAKDFGQNRTVPGTGGSVYGTVANYTGWAGKLDLGAKVDLSSLGAVTGWGEAGIGSGGATGNRNFQAIAGDYRPGQIWGRFLTSAAATFAGGAAGQGNGADNTTLSDLVVLGAGAKITPAALSKLTAGLSWWNYRLQTSNGVPTGRSGNRALGNEYDLDLSWAHSENVLVSAGVGEFQPGGNLIRAGIASNGTISSARLGYADLSVKF
ncbi:MAG TPA: hypothetical protein VN915_01815 [Elusimicrobiota bacterium]|nr:hypothetical protein [Elusimicrobiota bacterium]